MRQKARFAIFAVLAFANASPGRSQPAVDRPLALLLGQLAYGGPQFLVVSGGRRVPVDVRSTSILRSRLAIDLDSVSIREALKAVARRAGIELMYSEQIVPEGGRVDLHASEITVAAALTDVLLDTELDVVLLRGGQMGIVARPKAVKPPGDKQEEQAQAVGGTVVDGGSRPVVGANVLVVGTRITSTTDGQGRFLLNGVTGPEVELRIIAVGFRPLTARATAGARDLRLQLTEMGIALDEIVVTGTVGATQKRAIGNSVSTIDAADVVSRSVVSDLGQLLNARASGVIVTPGNGRVGAGPRINIRGRSTLSLGQQPLLYVDGVRVNSEINRGPPAAGGQSTPISRLNDINPEDIASIEIIKGPAAATIYGTEAANGVIQIITKKGEPGRTQWTVGTSQGVDWFMNAYERWPTNYWPDPTTGQLVAWNALEAERARGTPVFTSGRLQNYSLSLSGGPASTRYYVSSQWEDNNGIQPNNSQRRYTGHLNLTIAPNDKTDFSSSLNVVKAKTHLDEDSNGIGPWFSGLLGHPLRFAPAFRGFWDGPPEYHWNTRDNTQDLSRLTGSLRFAHRPTSWLRHSLTVGLDYTGEDNRALTIFLPEQYRQFSGGSLFTNGHIFQEIRNLTHYTADYGASVQVSLLPALVSTTSVGWQFYQKRLVTTQANGTGFPGPGVETVSATAARTTTEDHLTNTMVGAFAQQQFGWRNRLFITGAVRVDNNSAFGDKFDFATYPKLSGTWVMSEEPWWKVRWIDGLKLRAAFGLSGEQPDDFAALQTYRGILGHLDQPAVLPQFLGNPDLKPERSQELELGFEGGLWNRVKLDFTYFSRTTKDAIVVQTAAPSGGFAGQQFVNIAETSNHGMELQATVTVLPGGNAREVGWEISGNVGTTEDRITDLGGISFIALGRQRHVQGYPIGAIWGRKVVSAERLPDGNATNIMCEAGPTDSHAVPCVQSEFVFLGTITPKVTGAIANTITIGRNLRLYAMVDFKTGHRLYNQREVSRCISVTICDADYHPGSYDLLYVANLRGLRPGPGGALSTYDRLVEDASFAKLREVSVAYTLPRAWARAAGASQASLTVAGRNLHTWTKYTAFDPEELSPTANQNLVGALAPTPPLAQVLATIRVTF